MAKKETNEARMIGVLPSQGAAAIPVGKIPDGATHVAKSVSVQNDTILVHGVTSSSTLYLSLIIFSGRNISGATNYLELFVSDGQDVEKYTLAVTHLLDNTGLVAPLPFAPPLELASTWKIKLKSPAASVWGNAFIHGYEM